MRIEMYIEKRQQPYWLLALSLLMTSTFGVAVYAAVTETTGLVVGLVSSGAVGLWWWQGRAPIMVTSDALQVGRMKLPLEFIGAVTPLDASEFALRSGRNARADDAFSLLQRRYGGVVVENLDATDPFRHWVMGSRHAFQLADAITAAKETR
jgi:hypothetical protein